MASKEGKHIYQELISNHWEDLNECSSKYLDIYYCESDVGKSGFDIAQRINMLPSELTHEVPSIILWKESIKEAKSIFIRGLNNEQISELIRIIVISIKNNLKFENIIMEANQAVKELKNESGNNKYTGVEIHIGNEGKLEMGSNSSILGVAGNGMITHSVNSSTCDYEYKDFEKAVFEIKGSLELDTEMKDLLLSIIKEGQNGIKENSLEKQESSKKRFKEVKAFLKTLAPKLLEKLAQIATIATFFDLMNSK